MTSHKEPYVIDVKNVKITVFPDVYSPAYFKDSEWFAEVLRALVGQGDLLEIGTGTGIVALFAALNGGKITATDINPAAVENAKYNFKKHNITAKVHCGDMYEPVPPDQKFDVIFWNHPFNWGENPEESVPLQAGFDFHYGNLEKYIAQAHRHLKETGKLLLGTGNFALLPEILKIAGKNGYNMRLLKRIKLPLAADPSRNDNDYRIYEFNHDIPSVGDYVLADQVEKNSNGENAWTHGIVTSIDPENKIMEVQGFSGSMYTCIFTQGVRWIEDEEIEEKRDPALLRFVTESRKNLGGILA